MREPGGGGAGPAARSRAAPARASSLRATPGQAPGPRGSCFSTRVGLCPPGETVSPNNPLPQPGLPQPCSRSGVAPSHPVAS